MSRATRYSMGLLVVGMGLIAGSCVPAIQLAASGAQGPPVHRLGLPVSGEAVDLHLPDAVRSAPVVLLKPGPSAGPSATLQYLFEMRPASGDGALRQAGTTRLSDAAATATGAPPGTLALRFPEQRFAAGDWRVRFDPGVGAVALQEAELRLMGASPGLMATLMTTLTLAILGWLSACLGALQWIRAEAARDGAADQANPPMAKVEERSWVVGCHLSALLGYILPFGHLLGPLAIWLAKRDTLPGVEHAGRGILNFQLSVTLYVLVGLFLSFFLIGLLVLFLVVVTHFAAVLYAALRAQHGADVRYPLTLTFI